MTKYKENWFSEMLVSSTIIVFLKHVSVYLCNLPNLSTFCFFFLLLLFPSMLLNLDFYSSMHISRTFFILA